jgi:uncharacterized protein (DUF433 family)
MERTKASPKAEVSVVAQRNGGLYVAGSRVSLDSVVYAYLRGESPIGIAESFTSLSLDQINGAIEYYLANRAEVDAYLESQKILIEQMRLEQRAKDPTFYAKMDEARKGFLARRR